MELLCDVHGIGELRLLASALTRLSRNESRWITWINPPFVPYAPALARVGIDVGKVLLVHPKSHREALWALEQALKTGASSAALAWLDESALKATEIPPPAVGGSGGAAPGQRCSVPPRPADKPSMAEHRILVESEPGGEMRPAGMHPPEAPGRLAHFAHSHSTSGHPAHSPRARGRRGTARVLAP